MKPEEYVTLIERKLSKYFDTEMPYIYNNMEFQLFAKSFIRNERYIASKKLTVYAFENNEFTFAKTFEELGETELYRFIDQLKGATEDYVNPHSEHMSTVITGVLIVEKGLEEGLKNIVKNFKFMRSFAFGLKGWVYIRLLAIDLDKGEVICNKRGREIKKIFEVKEKSK